jgi:hypothetical protein
MKNKPEVSFMAMGTLMTLVARDENADAVLVTADRQMICTDGIQLGFDFRGLKFGYRYEQPKGVPA